MATLQPESRASSSSLVRSHTHTYRTEDIDDYIKSVRILAFGTYHAVFANPPYITVKDKRESDAYRDRYASCYREYSLSVPFAERIFKLAIRGSLDSVGAGYTGQITANSFMKREFGKKLIEEFFPQARPHPRDRHLRRLHPRPRHPHRDPLRPLAVPPPALHNPCRAGRPRRTQPTSRSR